MFNSKKAIPKCTLDCKNGGTCLIDSYGQQYCRCIEGFSGYQCEIGENQKRKIRKSIKKLNQQILHNF